MWLVIDTSVLLRLVASKQGFSRLKMAINRGMVLVVSDYLLEELERKLYTIFGMTRQRARTATRVVAKFGMRVAPTAIPKVSRDPTDDPIIAAAVVGQVDFLVSSDNRLLPLPSLACN